MAKINDDILLAGISMAGEFTGTVFAIGCGWLTRIAIVKREDAFGEYNMYFIQERDSFSCLPHWENCSGDVVLGRLCGNQFRFAKNYRAWTPII